MAVEQHMDSTEIINKTTKNQRKLDNSVLDLFGKLSNAQEKIRIKSGFMLLRHLSNAENTEAKYALGRLLRGLGSAKVNTRQGYYTCLVVLLNLKLVDIEGFFEYFDKELQTGSSNAKSENADISTGQILAAGAVIRSNLYEDLDVEHKKKIIEHLLKAGKERDYLALAAYSFIIELYNKINAQDFESIVFHSIKPEIAKSWQEQDLDTLYLLLRTCQIFPDSIKPKFLKNNLGTLEVLCKDSLPGLCSTLLVLPRATALKHPVYDTIVKSIIKTDFIIEFLQELDQNLARSNRNKFLAIVRILIGILENLSDENLTVLPELFQKNTLQHAINMFKTCVGKQKDPEFQLQMTKLFNALLDNLKKESVKDKIRLKVIKKLLFYPGVFIFEKISKTKLIQNITATLSTGGVKKLAELYRGVAAAENERVINENQMEKWWNMDRIYAGFLIIKLLNHSAMHEQNDWKVEQIQFFLQLGLFKSDIGQELADSFRDIFYSSLDLKLSKLEDLCAILSQIVNYINERINQDPTILRHQLTDDELELWKNTVEMIEKLEGKKRKRVFHTLFLHLSLQLFHSNNTKLAFDSLKELFSCYKQMKKMKKSDGNPGDDPLWIEVIIDLFLNLLSHNSRLLRNSIGCVFPHLCKHMTATAIHQILSVLDPKNEDNPLSKESDDDDDDDDESETEQKSGDGSESSDNSDDDDDEEDVDDDNDDGDVNDKLRMALQLALNDDAADDAESIDLDQLDEETGEKLDEALAKAFKQFKPNLGRKSKKQSKDDQTLTHFRVRALDLIEIYLNSQPSMHLTLEIMLPLLNCLEFCIRDEHQKSLQDRVKSCLKKLSSLRKFNDVEGVSQEILVDLLRSLLEKGTKNSMIIQDMSEKLSESCIFIVHCSSQLLTSTPSKKVKKNSVCGVIRDALHTFFIKRDCLIPYVLFKNILQQNWDGITALIPPIFEFVYNDNIRPFRRGQALELLGIFYNNRRLINQNKDEIIIKIQEAQTKFLGDSIDFFHNLCEDPQSKRIREKFLCGIFRLLVLIKSFGCDYDNWAKLGELIRECRSYLTFANDTKDSFKKLCRSLNIPNAVQMKNNTIKLGTFDKDADDIVEKTEKSDEIPTKKKKTRKLGSKDAKKLRKESKKLRMETLSEGFGALKRKMAMDDGDDKRLKLDEEEL